MQDFFEIARTDFAAAFAGAWLFPLLLVSILWIFLKEKDKMKKLLLCGVPLLFLFVYWCPFTGILFMKLGAKCVLEAALADFAGSSYSICGMYFVKGAF